MKTRLTILYSICCISMFQGTTFSQTSTFTHRNDSSNLAPLSTWGRIQRQTDKIITSNVFQMTYIGVPLIVSGLIIKNEDDHFQSLRNTYIPNFRYHYDDYLQYLPAVAMLGLKIGGVQGRSSWSRMLVSEAITASIMGATINTVKHTANVTRPDGSNNHSFLPGTRPWHLWPPPCCIKNTGRPVVLGIV